MSLRGQQNWLLFWICSAKNLSKKEVDFSSNSKVSFSVNASTRGPHLVRFHYLSMGIVRFKIIHTKYCILKEFLLDFFLLKVAFLKIHFTYLVLVHAVVWFLKVWTFWEGHKIKKNLPLSIWCYSVASNFKWKIFSNFGPFSEGLKFISTISWEHKISDIWFTWFRRLVWHIFRSIKQFFWIVKRSDKFWNAILFKLIRGRFFRPNTFEQLRCHLEQKNGL